MYFKFKENDIFHQTVVTCPTYKFLYINSSDFGGYKLVINNSHSQSAASLSLTSYNLNEINVDRTGSQVIYPFIDKTSNGYRISGYDQTTFDGLLYGTTITGTYLTFPNVYVDFITSTYHEVYKASLNIFNSYKKLNSDFDFANFPSGSSVHIFPREMCGSTIKKGSVIATINKISDNVGSDLHEDNTYNKIVAQDIYKDGILRVVQDPFTGSNAGTSLVGQKVGYVLYDHGMILFKSASCLFYNPLTDQSYILQQEASWHSGTYGTAEGRQYFNWRYFGDPEACSFEDIGKLLFNLEFQGTNNIENITMMCSLPKTQLNNSTNPTFINYSQNIYQTHSTDTVFVENTNLVIKNIVSSSYNVQEDFEKDTIISTVYILDEDKKVLGIAKLANPIIKKENTDRTIKIGFDI